MFFGSEETWLVLITVKGCLMVHTQGAQVEIWGGYQISSIQEVTDIWTFAFPKSQQILDKFSRVEESQIMWRVTWSGWRVLLSVSLSSWWCNKEMLMISPMGLFSPMADVTQKCKSANPPVLSECVCLCVFVSIWGWICSDDRIEAKFERNQICSWEIFTDGDFCEQ